MENVIKTLNGNGFTVEIEQAYRRNIAGEDHRNGYKAFHVTPKYRTVVGNYSSMKLADKFAMDDAQKLQDEITRPAPIPAAAKAAEPVPFDQVDWIALLSAR